MSEDVTELVPASSIAAGDRLRIWDGTFTVARVESQPGEVRLHLDRERIGFIQRDAWSLAFRPDTQLRRIVGP